MKKKLAVVLIISLFIAAMLPANVALAVTHVIESGQIINLSDPSYSHGDILEIDTTEPVEFMNGSGKDIYIECIADNANIIFNNVELQSTEWGIVFYGGTGNTLTLKGLNELYAGDGFPVIYVPLGVELTIQNGETTGQGELYADGSEGGGPGIGSDYEDVGVSNKITINDVIIQAYGGEGCAGIGSSFIDMSMDVTTYVVINSATVESSGGTGAAGIGGGAGANGDVEIYDSQILAEAGMDGAGIGGGSQFEIETDVFIGGRGDVHIEGESTILAEGGRDGAGIGGGDGGDGYVVIKGGFMEVYGGAAGSSSGIDFHEGDGAGIGGGGNGDGYVDIYDGFIASFAGIREYVTGAGIGGGRGGSGYVNIYGGAVWAVGGMDSAGIGGGAGKMILPDVYQGGLGDVYIEGETLIMAIGHRDGAGIGGGDNGDGYVDIAAGEVTAYGGQADDSDTPYFHEGDGAGIGGGGYGDGFVNISGGEIYSSASLTDYSTGAGIGGGKAGNGTVNIYGGIIYTCGGMDSAGIGGGAGKPEGVVVTDTLATYTNPKDAISNKVLGVLEEPTIIGGNGYVHIEGEPTISVMGYSHGAGIGGGMYGNGIVDIYGGEIAAQGGAESSGLFMSGYGAGIGGGGAQAEGVKGGNGTVNIYGGTIVANAVIGAAAIGGSVAATGTVLIANGDVQAIAGMDSAGIGGGPIGSGFVTITGGRVETVATEGSEAGIGNGHLGPDGSVDISGGLVIARGGFEIDQSAAGIGGSYNSNFGLINITGGQVYARAATTESEDIGAGKGGTCAGVNISGNSAVFVFYDNFPEATPILASNHMHIDEVNPNTTVVTANAAYGYTNFPDEWNGFEGYGYLRGYVVEFNHQDGTSNFETVWAGVPVPQPADPSRLGYIFNYWHTDMAGVNPYDFNLPVLNDMIIYAHWVEQGTHSGQIGGTLENPVGMPLQGYMITLQSQPVTVSTTNTGSFTFGSVFYINHTLIVNDNNGNELKRYTVTMIEGSSPGAVVDNDAGTIIITYVGDTTSVTIPLMYDGSEVIVSGPIIVDGSSNEIINPRTGETGSNNLVVVLIALLVIGFAGVIFRRKTAVKE